MFFNRSPKDLITIEFQSQLDRLAIQLSKIPIEIEFDWIFICLKEYQIKDAILDLNHLISSDTHLAIFQNGIDLKSPYTSFCDSENILETIIDCPIQRVEQDRYIQYYPPKITLPKNELAREFMSLFSDPTIEFNQDKNFLKSQWIKLIESSALGAIQVKTGKDCTAFTEEKNLEEYKQLICEGMVVARSEGVIIEDQYLNRMIEKLKMYPSHKASSMLTDHKAGNKLEIDAKIGAIKKIADLNNIDVPLTQNYFSFLNELQK